MNAQTSIAVEAGGRPATAVSAAVGLAGLCGLAGWTVVSRILGFEGPSAALVALLACGLPMIVWSLAVDKVHRAPTTGIDWASPPRRLSETLDISLAKIAALWATWGAIACFYCIARWYWQGNYLFAMAVLGYGAAPLFLLSVPYILWLDRRLTDPRDGAWHVGQIIVGRAELADREIVLDYLRGWAVKGFFLAFMFAALPGNWAEVIRTPAADILSGPVGLARWLIAAMFMVDITFATIGYMLTLKPLDAHIRSANPYMAGWVAALICYPPFILMNNGGPLDYHPGTADYAYWLGGAPGVLAAVAVLLVILTAIYAWATVAFGLRFSNLTHRGILTHGPYAWTKHPAYLSKNMFWWLATMPFLATTGSLVDVVRNTVVLGLVSGVYYWRARTEERHLMADPAYRAYAEWMARHGPLGRLGRRLFGQKGSEPIAAE